MNPFKRFFHLASRFAVRLFPIRPYFLGGAFDGAFVGLLESLGGVAGNTRVCVHVSLGDVVDDTLGCVHVSLGDVADDTLGCILVLWMFSIHIPTSPFPLRRAGNHPD